jgi:hypothetical protein
MSLRGLFVKNYRHALHFNTGITEIDEDSSSDLISRIQSLSTETLERYTVFKGHMLFGLHQYLPTSPGYITFLRDPVKRAISHYNMHRRHGIISPDHQIDPSRPDWNMGAYPGYFRIFDNFQTRLLSNAPLDLPFGAVTENHLQQARDNIERHFKFVGLTEHFDLCLILLRRHAGWKWHFYVPDNVAARAKVAQGNEIAPALGRLNRFDRALCDYVQEKLQQQVREEGFSLRLEYASFRLGNCLHQILGYLRRKIKGNRHGQR